MIDAADLRPYAFVIAVPDMDRAAVYFRDVLSFAVDWTDATDWRWASRGQVRVMIGHCPKAMPPTETGDHSYFAYIEVADVDALHDEFVGRGAIIRQPPADQPYGQREIVVATPDGHRMVFSQAIGAG